MSAPHPVLLDIAAGRPPGPVRDEDGLLRSADEHRMGAALLAEHERGGLRLTSGAVTTLGMWDLAERRRHLAFAETVREVEARLAPLGATVAVIKGIATEARWYDEPGERVCQDVDLFLDPGALDRVDRVVEVLDPDRGRSAVVARLARARVLQHVDLRVGGTPVDLHFDPLKLGVPTKQLREVWATTEMVSTPHGRLRVLRPEIELVLLVMHLTKDRFAYLGAYRDVARLLARARLDPDRLCGFVAAEGLDVPFWHGLAAVAGTLGLDLAVPRPRGLRAAAWDRLWGPHARLGGHEGRARAVAAQRVLPAFLTGRGAAALREARRQLLPRRELAEVAGRLEPGGSYLRYLLVDRQRSRRGHRAR